MLNQMLPSDRPDDQLIEDDAALDRWYESYQREMLRKFSKNQSRSATEYADVPTFSM